MPSLPTFSRIQELKADISAIANVPKANELVAAKAVTALLACYPGQQNQDERLANAFVQQLINACLGVDIDVLRAMVDAGSSTSLVRKQKWMPTIAEVADFIDSRMEPKRLRIGFYLDEIKAIEGREVEEAVPPAERERRVQMLKQTSALIRETARAAQRASQPLPVWQATEEEAQRGRLAALEFWDEMRTPGFDSKATKGENDDGNRTDMGLATDDADGGNAANH